MPVHTYFPKPLSLKWRILIPFIAALILLIAVFAYTVFAVEGKQLQAGLKHDIERIATYQKDSMALRGEKLVAIADAMALDSGLIAALAARDRQALSTYGNPEFEHIRKNFNVTHMYFLDSQRQILFRGHNPALAGNQMDSMAALAAEPSNGSTVGLALGKSGSYMVRAVVPVYKDGHLIGHVALGEEVLDSLVDLSKAFDVDGYVLLDKVHLAREDWELFMRMQGRKPEWDRYPDMVISAQTRPEVPKAMDALLTESEQTIRRMSTLVETHKQVYNIGSTPLLDSTGRKIGRLVVVHDVTEFNRQTLMRLLLIIGISVATGAVLSVFFHFLLKRTERDLEEAQEQAIDTTKVREAEQRQHIKELTDRLNDLERFEKLTVNRELRIKSLKEENRRLKTLPDSKNKTGALTEKNSDPAEDEKGG